MKISSYQLVIPVSEILQKIQKFYAYFIYVSENGIYGDFQKNFSEDLTFIQKKAIILAGAN